MPSPDPRELATANVGSNLRPRSATRDLRSSSTGWMLGKHTKTQSEAKFTQLGITGEFIRVFPARAEFRNTESNVTHVLTVTVVNRSDKAKRIRCVCERPWQKRCAHLLLALPGHVEVFAFSQSSDMYISIFAS